MGASNQTTSTQTSTPAMPAVTNTLTGLLGTLDKYGSYGPPKPFGQPIYTAPGQNTQQSWQSALTAAKNPLFSGGLQGAQQYTNTLLNSGGLTGSQQAALNASDALRGQYAKFGQDGGLSAPQQTAMNTLGGLGGQYAQLGQNGGFNAAQQQAMGSLGGLGGQYSQISANGGLNAPQQGALSTIGNVGNQYQNLANQGGFKPGMTGDVTDTRALADTLGGLGAKWGAPGMLESQLGKTAGGAYLKGANPYFEKNLGTALDQAGAGVNSAIGAGGRFGSGLHVNQLATTLGNLSNNARGAQYETERDRQLQAAQAIAGERATNRGLQLGAYGQQQGALGQAFGMDNAGIGNTLAALSGASSAANNQFQMGQQGTNNRLSALLGQQNLASQQFGMGQQGIGNQLSSLLGQGNVAGQQFDMGQTGKNNQLASLTGQGNAANQSFQMGQQGTNNVLGGANALANQFQTSLLPSATQGSVGSQQDADKYAQLLAQSQFYNANANNGLDWLAKLSSIFQGTAPYGGTQQTTTEPTTPLWQTLLGGGISLAGAFL